MTREEFRQICMVALEKQREFVIIDLSSKKHNGKYRSGLDEFSSFTYRIKLKIKTNIIFSLQNGGTS